MFFLGYFLSTSWRKQHVAEAKLAQNVKIHPCMKTFSSVTSQTSRRNGPFLQHHKHNHCNYHCHHCCKQTFTILESEIFNCSQMPVVERKL